MINIILQLSSGEITSRAGLDNIDVLKGHDNFEHMRVMVENLSTIIGGVEASETCSNLKKQIDFVQDFHKVNFSRHLEMGLSACTCLQCGFYDAKVDPIECKHHHKPPCKDCQQCFRVSFQLNTYYIL